MAINFRLSWQSLVHGADAPPDTLKEDGIGPGRLPNLLVNWLLVGLTEVVDGYLGDLSKRYEHTRWIRHGQVLSDLTTTDDMTPVTVPATWEQSRGVGGVIRGVPRQLANQAAEDNGGIVYYLDAIPRGARLTSIKVLLKGASGHTGLPTTMPKMRVVAHRRSDMAAIATDSDRVDASPDTATYQSLHTISTAIDFSDLMEEVDPAEDSVSVHVFGEAGSDGTTFKAGLQVYGIEVKYTLDLVALIQSATVVP